MIITEIMVRWRKLGAEVHIREYDGDSITLQAFMLPRKMRNKGLGTKFMMELTKYADCVQKTLTLTATDYYGTSYWRLKKFFKRFGFVENKGRNKDSRYVENMYRVPKNSTSSSQKTCRNKETS